ncbi:MAG: hypothetical protein C5B44_01940 [Acidobacteria bacterium]|nr:MAG: hypothetical protein C5B44_01940 [Acidobacteriota bacterium]
MTRAGLSFQVGGGFVAKDPVGQGDRLRLPGQIQSKLQSLKTTCILNRNAQQVSGPSEKKNIRASKPTVEIESNRELKNFCLAINRFQRGTRIIVIE